MFNQSLGEQLFDDFNDVFTGQRLKTYMTLPSKSCEL